MHKDTRRITEGAMMVAIVGMLLFLNRQFAGVLEYAMYWVLSFPILIYTVKYGWRAALIPAVSMLLLSLIIAMPTTMFYLASALLCGTMYGHGVRKGWPNGLLLLSTGILTLISYMITMVLFAAVFGYDPNEDILMAQQLAYVLNIQHVNVAQIALLASLLLTVLTAVLQTICVHLIAVLTLRRMKLVTIKVKSLFDCHFPKWLSWISICIWLLFFLKNMLKLEGNLLVVIVTLYSIILILMCAECSMDLLCIFMVRQQRLLGLCAVMLCIAALLWQPTQIMITLFGAYSVGTSLRQTWKRGGMKHGTIRKF